MSKEIMVPAGPITSPALRGLPERPAAGIGDTFAEWPGPGGGRPLHLVVVSTCLPRRCGLATFSRDLRDALAQVVPGWRVDVCAADRDGLRYGPEVTTVLRQDDPADYRRAARVIAASGADIVLIQHEYGIFGGPDGSYVTLLTGALRDRGVPYAVTLHTVLSRPGPGQAEALRRMCRDAAVVTTFTPTARRMLLDADAAAPSRVVVVPHGAPVALRSPAPAGALRPEVAGTLATLGDRPVLATFGLLGPGKGLETMIRALPAVAARHPRVQYVIAGATHPEEARRNGESYREGLVALAAELGVADQVRLVDAFLSIEELSALLARTDLYVTPYRSREQSCSGALTFAVAAGCPVVSTEYWYAADLLAPRNGAAPGRVVPCGDPGALAGAVSELLEDPEALLRARTAADALGATLTWPAVAGRLAATLEPVVTGIRRVTSPPLRLDHLRRLTGGAGGIVQFARGAEPDRASGHCVDDVARLAIVATGLLATAPPGRHGAGPRCRRWLHGALDFLDQAIGRDGMRNLREYGGGWIDGPHLGDHVGRAVWALGVVAADARDGLRRRAGELLDRLLPLVPGLTFPRTAAYAALGLARVADTSPARLAALRIAAGRLPAVGGDPGWRWFEEVLTYDNARLPQAMLAAGRALDEPALRAAALDALDWYVAQVGLTGRAGRLRCVGNGWRHCAAARHGTAAEGDEQPLDAAATTEALVEAWRATRSRRYAWLARRSHAWFHGRNRAGAALYDPGTGGCHDGLTATGVNPNQGAESTLAYYQSLLALAACGLIRLPGTTQSPRAATARSAPLP